MIEAVYRRDQSAPRLRCSGHAGYAPPGSDIVCAMVSVLMQALDAYLRYQGADARARLEDEGGYMEISARADEDGRVLDAFDQAAVGLKLVADAYPDCVRLEVHGGTVNQSP